MQKHRTLKMAAFAIINAGIAIMFGVVTWKYFRYVDVSGPGQQAYAQSNNVTLKLERLAVDERLLDIAYYGFLPVAALSLGISALLLWIFRKEKQNGGT